MAALSDLSASEVVRRFGLHDEIKIEDQINTTRDRITSALACVSLIGALSMLFIEVIFFDVFGASPTLGHFGIGFLLSLVMTIVILVSSRRLFLINVPAIKGVITTDLFFGVLHVYGPGFQIKYPWEQITAHRFVDLRLLTFPISAKFFTADGIEVGYRITVQYRGRLRLLPLFVRVERSHVDDAIRGGVLSILSREILSLSSQDLQQKEAIQRLERAIGETSGAENEMDDIQLRYGIQLEKISLSEPAFSTDYVQATTSQVIADKVLDTAQKFKNFGASAESAANSAMILNKENVTRDIKTVEGQDIANVLSTGIEAIGKLLGTEDKK